MNHRIPKIRQDAFNLREEITDIQEEINEQKNHRFWWQCNLENVAQSLDLAILHLNDENWSERQQTQMKSCQKNIKDLEKSILAKEKKVEILQKKLNKKLETYKSLLAETS